MTAAVTAWMLFSLVVGAVVCAAAIAAADAQRTARRAERWVWAGAIVLIVALSVLAPLRRSPATQQMAGSMPAASLSAMPEATQRATMRTLVTSALRLFAAPADAALRAVQALTSRVPARANVLLVAAWLVASILAFALLSALYVRVRRQATQWPSRRIDGVSVHVAKSIGPAVIGLAPPLIVVPQWLLDRPSDEQRLVIAHEQEHVRANDPWLLVAACLAIVVMPWNPALWYAFARLRFAVELDCDRRVLRRGVSPASYGALLIDLSALRGSLPSAMPAFSCNGSYLERRLVAMTSLTSRLATPRRIAGGLLAAAALVAACETKLPTAAEFESMNGADIVLKGAPLITTDSAQVRYFVDGVRVSTEVAKGIDAASIATVSVNKEPEGSSGEVRITTRNGAKSLAKIEADRAEAEQPGLPGDALLVRKVKADGAINVVAGPQIAMTGKKPFDGLLIVDGAIADVSMLKTISPDRIASIDVVKGASAAAAYTDPRAANGVIRITTKKP